MGSPLKTACAVSALGAGSLLLGAITAGATTGPGSAATVTADVAASVAISTLPGTLTPSLGNANNDTAYVDTPSLSKCNVTGTTITTSSCVFGDTTGTKTMVLWGDSHAFMWFPALDAIAKAEHWKLVALLEYGCPVADVSVWNDQTKTPYTACNTFRKNMISKINKLNPNLVVVSEAFDSQAAADKGADNTITTAEWQKDLETTLKDLKSKNMHKVVLGSTISTGDIAQTDPAVCLADNPTAVQKCTIADTAPQKAERLAEQNAATKEKTLYVNVLPWLCPSVAGTYTCSAVIGDPTNGYMVAYYSTGHITETYDLFLTTVLETSLKAFF